ncbi:MAG: hypothetical protein ABEJ64_01540 [Candidatus Nanohaloarchaea archaeon]
MISKEDAKAILDGEMDLEAFVKEWGREPSIREKEGHVGVYSVRFYAAGRTYSVGSIDEDGDLELAPGFRGYRDGNDL